MLPVADLEGGGDGGVDLVVRHLPHPEAELRDVDACRRRWTAEVRDRGHASTVCRVSAFRAATPGGGNNTGPQHVLGTATLRGWPRGDTKALGSEAMAPHSTHPSPRSSSPTVARSPCASRGPARTRHRLRRRLRRSGPRRAAREGRRRGLRARRHDPRATPTSCRTSSSRSPARPAPTPSTPATASSPRTPPSPRPSSTPGLTWIGPSPAAIDSLGDKVKARHIAAKADAPLVPGTADPVEDADEVVDVRQGARAAGRHQGGLRRRRARPQGRPHPRGDPRAVRLGHPRGGRRLRPRRVLRRAVPRQARATSRPSAWPTPTATSSSSRPATARCSAATRSSSRRRPRRS